jgi:hypothetical protein
LACVSKRKIDTIFRLNGNVVDGMYSDLPLNVQCEPDFSRSEKKKIRERSRWSAAGNGERRHRIAESRFGRHFDDHDRIMADDARGGVVKMFARRHSLSIQARLTMLALVTALPLVVLACFAMIRTVDDERAQAQRDVRERVEDLIADVDAQSARSRRNCRFSHYHRACRRAISPRLIARCGKR